MHIRISARALVTGEVGNSLSDDVTIELLDGAKADELISDYFNAQLAGLGITGGTVGLRFDDIAREWRVESDFNAPGSLLEPELKSLADETDGQWSDGIGEGAFIEMEDLHRIAIDLTPYHIDRDFRIEQIDDGRGGEFPNLALPLAAFNGDLIGVRKLLDAGEDLETRWQGSTPLILAILSGHEDIAFELISRGAHIGARDGSGCDALFVCAASNRMQDDSAANVARLLLENGVDPHYKRGRGEGDDYTPLQIARNRNKKLLAKVIQEFRLKKSGRQDPK